jgi:hypothetical protein
MGQTVSTLRMRKTGKNPMFPGFTSTGKIRDVVASRLSFLITLCKPLLEELSFFYGFK